MTDQANVPDAPPPARKDKKDKIRGAWISFVGRIVAQVIGAVASVVLGIMVIQRYQSPPPAPAPADPPQAPARASQPRRPGEAAIAVLPLDDFSGQPEREYFADGMTESLIASLAQVEGLRVISRTSTMAYKGRRPSLAQVARELDVDLVVEGSVTQSGERVRITAQLIDAATDEHLWARTYDRTRRDLLSLQDEVATAIAREVKGSMVKRRPGPAGVRAVDPAVYDLYLRGRYAWNRRTAEGFERAVSFFEQAVARDPEFALAHVGLADAFSLQGSPSRGIAENADRVARARTHAQRAVALDANLAEAHTALAGIAFFGDRNFDAAERGFRQAIALNPNYPVAHEWLAILLSERGRDAEAREHIDRAVALDPLEATMHQARGLVHYHGRRYAEAAEAERRALALTPQLPLARALLARSLLMAGDAEAVLAVCSERGETDDDPSFTVTCGLARVRRGDSGAAEATRLQLAARPAPEVGLAQWDAATGDFTRAFASLEVLARNRNLPPSIGFDPLFDGLRADRRWSAFANRAALSR